MAGNDFLGTYTPLANDIATQTGLDPSVVLGIIDTETGGGARVSGNNIFGISPGGRVAGYPDVQTAANAFVTLMNSQRYRGVAGAGDPAAQAAALVKAGYNTANPNYAGIVAGKAANFGKQLGYQNQGDGSPSGPGIYTTSSQPTPDYNTPSPNAAQPAAQPQPPQSSAPDYNNVQQPAQSPPAPAPTGSTAKDRVLADPALSGAPSGTPAQPSSTPSSAPQSAKDRVLADPALQAPPAEKTTETAPDQPTTTLRGVARNVGAGLLDAAGNVINVLSDPVGNLVIHPLAVVGGTAYDAAARTFGFTPMTPEQRADLYGQPQPGQSQLPPEQQQIGTRAINALDAAIPGQKASNLPASPAEQTVRAATGGAATAAALAPNALLAGLAGGVGGAAGDVAARFAPDWLKPGAELAGNALGATAVGAGAHALRTPVGLVDAGKAALADTAIKKYDIPLEASDLTADPRFARTGPASVAATAAKQDAWQGSIIKEMGGDGDKFTPKLMSDTATRTGKVYDDIAQRTTISQPAADNLVHNDLAAIEANLDTTAGLTDSDKAAIRKRMDEIVNAVQSNGTISGGDYRALTKTNSPLDRLENNSNPEVAKVAGDIRDAIDGAFTSSASRADQAALTRNNYQYRIMRTVQDLVAKSPDGNIKPGEFMTKVASASRRFDPTLGGMAYTGGGNIGELARIGAMMDTTPNFAPRTSAGQKALTTAAELAATLSPAYFVHPGLAAVAPALTAAYYLRGAYLPSNAARNTLIRNALNPPSSSYSGVVPSLVTGGNPLMPR